MNRTEKTAEIEVLRQGFQQAQNAVLVGFAGLTVTQVNELRRKVRDTDSSYRVVKNRLALRSLKETPLEPLSPQFEGPTAIAWGAGEPTALAKVLNDFARDNQGLTIKAGFVDGRLMGAEEVRALAVLPSREVLIARLLGALTAPVSGLLRVMSGPARALVRTLDQIAKNKKESAGSEPQPAPGTPPQT